MTDTKQIYEVGFLLVPALSEESLGGKVSQIKSILEKAEAEIISEEAPKLKQLAYTMAKKTDEARRDTYEKGYFGWVKFGADIAVLPDIEAALKADSEIIRYIVIKTVRENTIIPVAAKASPLQKDDEAAAQTGEDAKEMDESIDELVIE